MRCSAINGAINSTFRPPLPSPCPGKVDESSFDIRPDELNVNSISDIQAFKPSHQLSFDRRVGEANRKMF
jgi:hypothetical protein